MNTWHFLADMMLVSLASSSATVWFYLQLSVRTFRRAGIQLDISQGNRSIRAFDGHVEDRTLPQSELPAIVVDGPPIGEFTFGAPVFMEPSELPAKLFVTSSCAGVFAYERMPLLVEGTRVHTYTREPTKPEETGHGRRDDSANR